MHDLANIIVLSGFVGAFAIPFLVLGAWQARNTSESEAPNRALGMGLVGVAAIYSIYSAFAIAGGPDARFLMADSLILGTTSGGVAAALGLVASRLFRVNGRWALLMIAPTLLEFVIAFLAYRAEAKVLLVAMLWMLLILPLMCAGTFVIVGFRRGNHRV